MRIAINKMQGDFFGKLTSTKWRKIAKCSLGTAGRDIYYLLSKNVLLKKMVVEGVRGMGW